MDQETALELVKKGATLLLLDVPQYTLFGIDTQMFSVGPLFKGIKMIPPGPHFIYYSPANRSGNEFSPMIGFFTFTTPSEVVVLKWHPQEEHLIKLSLEDEERYCEAAKHLEFDHHLGPYDLECFSEWKQISCFITKATIERIEPVGREITVAYETNLINTVPRTAAEKQLAEQLKNSKFSRPLDESHKQGCYYSSIPHLVKHKGKPEELTAMNLDKTQLLETILMKDFGGAEDLLLGELQFAFVAFLMGQSLQAFYQWKSLVSLLLNCTEAPFQTRTSLFSKFVKVLYYQLRHGLHKNNRGRSGDGEQGVYLCLDDLWLSRDNFLNHLCKDFFLLVEQAPVVDGDLLLWTRKLRCLLETTFGWNFQDKIQDIYEEGDEFSPVILLPNDLNFGEA